MGILLVALGGGIGAFLRYLFTNVLQNKFNLKHWATFCVNITGCFVLGGVFNFLSQSDYTLFQFVIIGIIGSYTTFSTFEYENIDLIAHEKYFEFIKYAVCSCLFAFVAVAVGFYFAQII